MPQTNEALTQLRAARDQTRQAAQKWRDMQTRARASRAETPQKQVAALREDLAARKEAESRILKSLLSRKAPQDVLGLIDQSSAHLIVLLPVRIETKFCGQAGGRTLKVRVFPDELEVETHEERLTLDEYSALKDYWQRLWMAGQDDAQESRKRFAWKSLCDLYGPWRSAYLVSFSYYRPDHLDERGNQPPDDDPSTGLQGFAMNDLRPADLREGSWTEPPVANVLPDMWVLRLIRGDKVVYERPFDNPVPTPLHVGPSPTPASANSAGQTLDDDSEWLIDFGKAVDNGMAFELPISETDFDLGFDRAILCGLKVSSDRESSDRALLEMLSSHRYTDGLRILSQGTPTHNTPDAPSAESSKDLTYDASYATLSQDLSRMSPSSNARRLARFLGYSPFLFDRCENAALDELGPCGGMATALWSVSWGYFLTQMTPDSGITREQFDRARRYFVDHVHARGILPSLQAGKKPYGLLPVTTLKSGVFVPQQDGSGEDLAYAQVSKLYPKWSAMAEQAPHVGRSSAQSSTDIDSDFTESLSMLPGSWTVRGRLAYGRTFLQNLFNFYGVLMDPALRDAWWGDFYSLSGDLLSQLQYAFRPRALDLVFQGESFPLLMDLVQPGPTSPDDIGLSYLGEMAGMTFFQLRDLENADPSAPWPLFKSILRHAFMLEYMRASFRILDAQGVSGSARPVNGGDPPEPEVVTDDPSFPEGASLLNRLNTVVNGQKVVDYVATDDANTHYPDAVRAWREFRDSLSALDEVPTKDLERLFSETLDCCSHRLDAWASSFAAKRLEEMKPAGDDRHDAVLAAYAWAEDLRADKARTFVQDSVEGPVETAPEGAGYIHAPSLNQARTAAVLRNAYLSHAGGAQAEAMNVNLSSERVRRARGYLDGVRQGQPLGALLGYRFERLLQDRYASGSMEPYVQPFRDAFPLVDGKLTPDDESTTRDAVAPRNVVDGLALFRAWKSGSVPWGEQGLPQESDVTDALDQLDKDIDGLADLGLAESVHQAVNGNPTRGGAILDAIADGSFSPDPDVVRTPRSGCSLTHRVAVLFNQPFAASPNARGRVSAEPRLDAWASRMFGDISRLACTVGVFDAGAQDPPPSPVMLASLGLSSLDLVFIGESELEAMILHSYRLSNGGLDTSRTLNIDWTQPSAQGAGIRAIPDLIAMAKLLRQMIGSSRPLHARDFQGSDQAADAEIISATDAAAFLARGQDALTDFTTALDLLPADGTPLPSPPPDIDVLRRSIQEMVHFGLTGATPVTAGTLAVDLDLLWAQAQSLRAASEQRKDAAQSALDAAAGAIRTPDFPKARQSVIDAFQAIFGKDFSVLPDTTLPDQDVVRALQNSAALLDPGDPLAPQRWFQQLSQVRSRLADYETSMMLAESYQTGPSLDFSIVQFPMQSPDRWIGLPIDPARPPQHGKVGMVATVPLGLQVGLTVAGLALDEWAEEIPASEENTGIAFNFKQPGLEAPQCVLLAVPPDRSAPWSWEALMSAISDTLDLAKIRGVDLQSMKGMGQYLPALYFASNPKGDTVSTDFLPDAAKAGASFRFPL